MRNPSLLILFCVPGFSVMTQATKYDTISISKKAVDKREYARLNYHEQSDDLIQPEPEPLNVGYINFTTLYTIPENILEPAPTVDGLSFGDYIMSNLAYPEEAKTRNVTGIVTVTSMVDQFEKMRNLPISKSLGPFRDEEALGLLRSLNKRTPAHVARSPVICRISKDIIFHQA